ncbi:MAG: methyltransferase domain-containing protein [Gammaproteobacteria bacterium]|nr:methyltransferase domain-containing protein [Gammaproteobacteria bacterium]MDH5650815.1 methyltransferase domain-containing protein [Gammaproteobacteria bacterium]
MGQGATQWNAADYAAHSSAQFDWAQSLIREPALDGSESVLDIGCGDGRITRVIAAAVTGLVIGIDHSSDMVNWATSQHHSDDGRLSFRQMDATQLEFAEEFDLVFSNAVLHWVRDHQAVLAGIQRSLKPAGRAVLSMGGKGNAPDILPVVDELICKPQWQDYFTDFVFPYAFYGIEEYEQWLPPAGLQAKRIELVPKEMVHEDVNRLKGWIRTTWFPYTDRLPAGLRETFIDQLVRGYLQKYPVDNQGRTHVRMIRLEVEAEKI